LTGETKRSSLEGGASRGVRPLRLEGGKYAEALGGGEKKKKKKKKNDPQPARPEETTSYRGGTSGIS